MTDKTKTYREHTDEDLARALQQGDDAAYDEIVRRHQSRIFAVAYRVTGNREDALDVAQEALLKAYRKIDAWKPTGGFQAWLTRLTANQAIDFVRRRKRRQHEPLDEAYVPTSEGAAVGPTAASTERAVRAIEIDERVREALVVLSPAQRTVFMLRHYEGMQLSEIADQLGCTIGSVKVHLFRSLKKMRKELDDLYSG